MKRAHLPAHLHDAYDWTAAAGELTELRDLTGQAPLDYCRDSAANSLEHAPHPHDAVSAYDLEALHDWLVGAQP